VVETAWGVPSRPAMAIDATLSELLLFIVTIFLGHSTIIVGRVLRLGPDCRFGRGHRNGQTRYRYRYSTLPTYLPTYLGR
jgi:hypothetical protein